MSTEKTSIEKLSTMNLEGLFLPEPVPPNYSWVWILFACFLALSLWFWRKRYYSPKATALRELQQLKHELKEGNVNAGDLKTIKQQIALSLRQGFDVVRLEQAIPGNSQWLEYINSLDIALYQNENDLKSDQRKVLLSLLTSAETWLKNGSSNFSHQGRQS